MKINPIAIQQYQQLTRQETQRPQLQQDETLAKQSQVAENRDIDLTIEPKGSESSRLAVKGPSGSYAEYLSTEEKQALELLFARFRDSERFGPGYREDSATGTDCNRLGQVIDVKV